MDNTSFHRSLRPGPIVVAVLLACGVVVASASLAASDAPGRNSVSLEFPYQYIPGNLPDPALAKYFPRSWPDYASSAARNPVFPIEAGAPTILTKGVRWRFAGAGAIPLDGPPLNGSFVTTAYSIGMPVGVSTVDGMIYVGDDNGYTYALNAITGKLIWAHYGWNMTMSNPLVLGGKVYVSTGSAYFNYANTMLYIQGKRPTRGPGLNSMYALDAKTGRKIWTIHFDGEAMPTAAFDAGYLYIGTGDGHVYKIDASSGRIAWKSDLVSFVSMSSPVVAGKYVYLGGTDPNYFYALNKRTGAIVWKFTLPHLVATGMGDCTPAYADGIVVQEATVETGNSKSPVANVIIGLDAKTGRVAWKKRLESGPTPPAMKTATPMVVHGKVFEGSPVSGRYYCFDLRTGRELWNVRLGAQIRAGAAVANGIAYVPYKAGDIAAIRVSDGKLLTAKHFGGAFGPSSPVVVGGTLYVSNVYGWVLAVPLSDLANSSS
jgi:polyvinyl alcohol dehydrogenase (cytochrome)